MAPITPAFLSLLIAIAWTQNAVQAQQPADLPGDIAATISGLVAGGDLYFVTQDFFKEIEASKKRIAKNLAKIEQPLSTTVQCIGKVVHVINKVYVERAGYPKAALQTFFNGAAATSLHDMYKVGDWRLTHRQERTRYYLYYEHANISFSYQQQVGDLNVLQALYDMHREALSNVSKSFLAKHCKLIDSLGVLKWVQKHLQELTQAVTDYSQGSLLEVSHMAGVVITDVSRSAIMHQVCLATIHDDRNAESKKLLAESHANSVKQIKGILKKMAEHVNSIAISSE